MNALMNPDLKSILCNILGGVIVAVLSWIYIKTYKRLNAFRFKIVFGKDSITELKLVYGKMVLKPCYDEHRKRREFPYSKIGSSAGYRVSSILADTEAISIKYLSDSFSKNTKESPSIASDEEISDKIDISFIAVGGLNNKKTVDILDSQENTYYRFDYNESNYVDKITTINDEKEVFLARPITDYGMIIKTRPRQFPSRIHFCVAGIGEYGTRGASYFLATKWKEILKKTKGKEFGIIIKVSNRIDESAEMVKCIVKK